MGDLDTLAVGGEQHGVITDDVASAHSGETNGLAITSAGLALTTIHRHLFQIATQRIGNHLSHAHGSAGRRIDFMPMVSLGDFDIDIVAQYASGRVEQLQAQVDPDTEVGREDNRNVLARFRQQLLFFNAETGGTDDHGLAVFTAESQVLQGHRRVREVDQHVELVDHPIQIAGQRHADATDSRQLTSIRTDQRAVRTIHCRRQPGARRLLHRFNQGLAHAPGGAHHCNTSHACLLTNRRRSASRLRTNRWFLANGCCHPPANYGIPRAFHAGDGSG
ncbi:hypothetical protein D3C71_1330150 [compost metagenome]